jgi:hypothetical protein
MHFGHFIAGIQDKEIASFEAVMRNIPFKYGFSPRSWRRTMDFTLLKEPGNFLIKKLRLITLMGTEFNDNNKIIGRDMMAYAEKHNAIAPEQQGCRKHKSSITQALNKMLVLDNIRQLRKPGCIASNDLKSCFDRMVHNVTILCLMRMGYPDKPLLSAFDTLQKMKHYVRTALGDSEEFYDAATFEKPPSSIGQGNGHGPQSWAVVSTPILENMKENGYGVEFISALTLEIVKMVAFSFVDDTDLVNTVEHEFGKSDEEVATKKMQGAIDRWGGLVNASGGASSHAKSSWTLITFHWNSDGSF